MATEHRREVEQSKLERDASPFERQAIDGLPLTKTERAELELMVASFDAEHGAPRLADDAHDGASATSPKL